MADIRINALATTAASTASDDFVAVDGSANGTRKLNAYSPTFGGNLTVSGTGTANGGVVSGGSPTGYGGGEFKSSVTTAGAQSAISTFATGGAEMLFDHRGTGNTGAWSWRNGTGAASTRMSLSADGNLTVNGTGNSSFGGNVVVANTVDGIGFWALSAIGGDHRFSLTRYDGVESGSALLSAFGGINFMYNATSSRTSGTVGMVLNNSGKLLIGTTIDGGQKLQVNGTAAIAGTATATRLIANSQWVAASAGTGALSATANAGVQLTGTGAVNDITLVNKNGDNVMVVPTGTTNATFAGRIGLTASGTNPIYSNFIPDSTNTYAGLITMQAGGGSSSYGGGLQLYGHSHASKPGWVSANISQGSSGKFAVNNSGLGGGTDVFTVDTGGNATFAGAIAIGNTVNTVSPTSPNRTITMVIGGTTYYLHAKTTND